jgi:cation diffusion facilitator CzcD-associated flavoprotein CzcO
MTMTDQRLNVKTVGVIGAGVSGVATAIHLRKAGLEVKVFERNPYIGGVWYDHSHIAIKQSDTNAIAPARVFDERKSKDAAYPSVLPSVGDSPEYERSRTKRKDSKTGSPVDEEFIAWDNAAVEFAPPGPCYEGLRNNVSTHEMEMQCVSFGWRGCDACGSSFAD